MIESNWLADNMMNKIKEDKGNESQSEILIIDYSRRNSRTYSLETHNKATLPIKSSKSLVKLHPGISKHNPRANPKPKHPHTQTIIQPLTKSSTHPYNMIAGFSISTHHGLHYPTNEDSISIQLGTRSMFGLFDGYNGNFSSSFLKKMLTDKIQWSSPKHPQTNIYQIFDRLDQELLKQQERIGDNSGSSALMTLFQKQTLYIANCGTSLAFGKTSTNSLIRLNNIHSCQDESQRRRVTESRGTFYRTRIELDENQNYVEGPLRVNGYKTVQTRTLGYPLTKDRKVVISKPEIKFIKTQNLQWVCMTTSGLLTVISDIQIYSIIEREVGEFKKQGKDAHKLADKCAKRIMEEGLRRKCMQNMSVIVIFIGDPVDEDETKVRNNRSNTSTQAGSLNMSTLSFKGRIRKATSMN